MSRVLIAVVAGLIGLAASVSLYAGLVHAVPWVDRGTEEEEFQRADGADAVRLASVIATPAGVLLMIARAWWTGAIAVATACLMAVLAHGNTIASWGLLLNYVLVPFVGCGSVVGRAKSRPGMAPSRGTRGRLG